MRSSRRTATLRSVDVSCNFSLITAVLLIRFDVALSQPRTLFFCTTSKRCVGIQSEQPKNSETSSSNPNGPTVEPSMTSSIVAFQRDLRFSETGTELHRRKILERNSQARSKAS